MRKLRPRQTVRGTYILQCICNLSTQKPTVLTGLEVEWILHLFSPGASCNQIPWSSYWICSTQGFASLVAQLVKNPPAMQETWVRFLGWKDPWRRERLPTPVFWPGEFHGLYVHGVAKSWTWLRNFTSLHRTQPRPAESQYLGIGPGNFHGPQTSQVSFLDPRVCGRWAWAIGLAEVGLRGSESGNMRACVLSRFSLVQLCATLWTVACQAPLSLGFSRQEYWSRLACPLPGNLSDPGIEPVSLMSPALAIRFFTTCATWEACLEIYLAVIPVSWGQVKEIQSLLQVQLCHSLARWP